MKPNVLLLTAALIALALSACVQPERAALQLTGPSCITDGAGGTTLKVLVLQNGYSPSSYYPPNHPLPQYARPNADPSKSITPAMGDDFAKAFAVAPQFFKRQLCALDGIFVNPTGCSSFDATNGCTGSISDAQVAANSWGFKEGNFTEPMLMPGDHYHRYVALSAGAWNGAAHAPLYRDYEQRLLQQLLFRWPANKTPPAYDANNTNPNTSEMAILAALAHEFGHVLWYDTFHTDGQNYNFGDFCSGTFFNGSWQLVNGKPLPPPRWRNLGDTSTQLHDKSDVQLGWVEQVLSQGDDRGRTYAAYYLDWYHNSNGHWASYFGTRSPDEDFVETFKFYVLQSANPPLTALPIMIRSTYPYNYDDDIPAEHPIRPQPAGVYETKRDCFVKAFP